MSEFPALRESLVRAAAHRRRRRLTFRAAVPALALATAAVVLVLAPTGESPRREEREVATPAPARTPLEEAFGVFRRPRTRADEVPANIGGGNIPGPDWDNSRLLAKHGDDRFYAVPSTDGLCLILLRDGKNVSSMCGPVETMATEGAAPGSVARGRIAFLFPDGTRDVSVTTRDGESWGAPRLTDNAILLRGELAVLSFTGASGRRYIQGSLRRPLTPPARCPAKLGALPADPDDEAVRAALRVVQFFYPEAREAEAKAARPSGTPCGAAITRRTVEVRLTLTPAHGSASLAQGRLLVGMVDGRMQVYYLLH